MGGLPAIVVWRTPPDATASGAMQTGSPGGRPRRSSSVLGARGSRRAGVGGTCSVASARTPRSRASSATSHRTALSPLVARLTDISAQDADRPACVLAQVSSMASPDGSCCRVLTMTGSNVPATSRKSLVSAGPTSVSTVFARVPSRLLPLPRPSASCFSCPEVIGDLARQGETPGPAWSTAGAARRPQSAAGPPAGAGPRAAQPTARHSSPQPPSPARCPVSARWWCRSSGVSSIVGSADH